MMKNTQPLAPRQLVIPRDSWDAATTPAGRPSGAISYWSKYFSAWLPCKSRQEGRERRGKVITCQAKVGVEKITIIQHKQSLT